MDPEANIKEQRATAAELLRELDESAGADWSETDQGTIEHIAQLGTDLATLVEALDEWRRGGGYDPYL